VLAAVRLQLKQGASQIKLAGGGGVISAFDPLDVTQYSPEELRAAVEAASAWGTYVALHVYTPTAMRQALEAGVTSIEHGHLADEATVKLMAEKGAWLSTQPWEPSDFGTPAPGQEAKGAPLVGAWQRVLTWAKQYGVKVAFGTDLLFDPDGTSKSWSSSRMVPSTRTHCRSAIDPAAGEPHICLMVAVSWGATG
jgi:imidazolonepropionase-like amidohydrolase